jgi:hypothetical protein
MLVWLSKTIQMRFARTRHDLCRPLLRGSQKGGVGKASSVWRPTERIGVFYNQRDTAEQWIEEGKNVLKSARLSCHSLRPNEARLQLPALAYNLAIFLRTFALSNAVTHWSLTGLREKLI